MAEPMRSFAQAVGPTERTVFPMSGPYTQASGSPKPYMDAMPGELRRTFSFTFRPGRLPDKNVITGSPYGPAPRSTIFNR